MSLEHYFWYFQRAIPNRICDDIVKYGKLSKEKEILGLVGAVGVDRDAKDKPLSDKEMLNLKQKRDSNIVWMSDSWIYKEIHPYIHVANKSAGWNFEWDTTENCQFTKYSKGQYYDWHCDSWVKPYEKPGPFYNKIRKLSVSVSLSDPSEYEGGELEFDFRNDDPSRSNKRNIETCTQILPKGSLVIFPSFVWHRVKPVKKGTRYSLVVWNLGYPFK
tara:strand:- start:2851 stop:3501 length:651 start_codon:yes stop_codon:yes gene_type:complete